MEHILTPHEAAVIRQALNAALKSLPLSYNDTQAVNTFRRALSDSEKQGVVLCVSISEDHHKAR